MKADEARRLANATMPVAIDGLLKHVHLLIERAAGRGCHSIADPLRGLRCPISPDQRNAVWTQLIRDGYRVDHHNDPDPGHYASSSYTEVSW